MNRQEQMQFIDREIKGLWPQWQPTEAEVRVWLADLAGFDYAVARAAAQACFREQRANYHRPVLGRFLAQARAVAPSASGRSRRGPQDVTTTVFIECFEPPQGRPHLAGVRKPVYVWPASRQSNPDDVLAAAEHMRAQFDRLYGGHWITVCTRPPAGNAPMANLPSRGSTIACPAGGQRTNGGSY